MNINYLISQFFFSSGVGEPMVATREQNAVSYGHIPKSFLPGGSLLKIYLKISIILWFLHRQSNTLSSWVCLSIQAYHRRRAKSIFAYLTHKRRKKTIIDMSDCSIAYLFISSRSYKMVLIWAISASKPLWEQLHSSETRSRPPTRQYCDDNRTWQPWGTLLLSQPNQLNRWPSTAPDMGHSRVLGSDVGVPLVLANKHLTRKNSKERQVWLTVFGLV